MVRCYLPADSELECLQHRLKEWARWTRLWKPDLDYPDSWPLILYMKPNFVHDGDGQDEKLDEWAMNIIESSIASLKETYQVAIYAVYLGNRQSQNIGEAESQLLVLVRGRGLLLI